MKRRFTFGGAIVGLLCGVVIMALAYIQAPSMPGMFELLLQGVIVGVLVLAGAIVGFLVSCLVSLFVRKKRSADYRGRTRRGSESRFREHKLL